MDSKGDERRVCVITGANSGIGFATALGMAQRGWQVVLACRSLPSAQEAVKQIRSKLKQEEEKEEGEEENEEEEEGKKENRAEQSEEEGDKKEQSEEEDQSLVAMKLDLADLNSVDEFALAFQKRFTKLHALILNAGVAIYQKVSAQGHELMFAVNHLGHFLLTQRLLPVLQASAPSRIVVVASESHRTFCGPLGQELSELTNPPQASRKESFTIYCRTKLCNLLFTHELNKRLNGNKDNEQVDESSSSSSKSGGVTVNALHPGLVNSGMVNNAPWYLYWICKPLFYLFWNTPEYGAKTPIYLATSDEVAGVSGKYFVKERAETPVLATPEPYAVDDDAAARLWKWSEELIAQWESSLSTETDN